MTQPKLILVAMVAVILGISPAAFAQSQGGINDFDTNLNTPLHNAIQAKDDDAVRDLIKRGADLELKTGRGETALHLAIWIEPKYVPWLLDAGANPDATDRNGWTPVHYASAEGKVNAVKDLVTAGGDVDARIEYLGWTPIHVLVATRKGNPEDSLRALIREGADFGAKAKDGRTPLRLEETREGGKTRNSGIAHILRHEVRDLINQRYHLHGWSALFHAVKRGNANAVETLIIHGADVHIRAYSDKAESALHLAALYSPNTIPLLVNARADINARDSSDWTPMHYAASEGHLDGVKALFRGRADPNIRNNIGATPLHVAAGSHKYNFPVVQMLIHKGADVNERDNNAWTPLHYAAASGKVDAVNAILDAGADINARNNKGWTPVHAAIAVAKGDNRGVLRTLILRRAKMGVDSEDGKPLEFAIKYHGEDHHITKIVRDAAKIHRR